MKKLYLFLTALAVSATVSVSYGMESTSSSEDSFDLETEIERAEVGNSSFENATSSIYSLVNTASSILRTHPKKSIAAIVFPTLMWYRFACGDNPSEMCPTTSMTISALTSVLQNTMFFSGAIPAVHGTLSYLYNNPRAIGTTCLIAIAMIVHHYLQFISVKNQNDTECATVCIAPYVSNGTDVNQSQLQEIIQQCLASCSDQK